jgi:putative transposase
VGDEAFDQRYERKTRGIDSNKVKERVAEIMDITPEDVTAYDKSPQTVQARSLLCFWAHRKQGMSTVQIARLLNMSQPAISRSSRRGEKIARENQFELFINRNA